MSRKLGKAVVRNRVKRRLREATRSLADLVPLESDVVFSARMGCREADFWALRAAVEQLLERAAGRKSPRSEPRPEAEGRSGRRRVQVARERDAARNAGSGDISDGDRGSGKGR